MSKNNIFTKEDYMSGDGMMTSIWGPPLWHVLHTISFNYPDKPTKEDKQNYYNFFNNVIYILPCKYCRDNLLKNYKTNPLNKSRFKSRDTLSRWVYSLHETINKMLGKKSHLTFGMVRERYEHFRSRCLNKTEKIGMGELGCTKSLHGIKGKCVLNIVPNTAQIKSFNIDPKCNIKSS
jgi:hypothetical protein